MKKLWEKGYTTSNLVEKFTVGTDRIFDEKLAIYDIRGNRAHAEMLHKVGLLSHTEKAAIMRGLASIETEIMEGYFTIEEQFEDIHSKIEFELVRRIGDAGKKIHTGRSRNDQILVDLHLYVKAEIEGMKSTISRLFHTLIELAEKHRAILLPGYTHTQVAMPSSFGLWFSAYAESLIDDLYLLHAAYKVADQNPLGSAAGQGTSLPIDRTMTTRILGFSTLKYNVVAAQMSRGKLEKSVAYALASVSGTIGKLAADICLYMSQNFQFISFPKELTTGSSIMPHKMNPDVFELIRARSNKLQQLPSEITMITANLTSGYHRDYQILKESLMYGIDTLKENLEVSDFMLQHIKVNENILDNPIYDYLFSVEAVNKMVLEGVPFREAYQRLAADIVEGKFKPMKELHHTHEGSIGNLCLDAILCKFNQALKNISTPEHTF